VCWWPSGEGSTRVRAAATLATVAPGRARTAHSIATGGVTLFDLGQPVGGDAEARAHEGLTARRISIDCDLGVGDTSGEVLTTDFSHGYVDINAAYEP